MASRAAGGRICRSIGNAERIALRRSGERLDVRDQREHLFFIHNALERWHHRTEARHDLRPRSLNGFAQVVLIRNHRLPVVEELHEDKLLAEANFWLAKVHFGLRDFENAEKFYELAWTGGEKTGRGAKSSDGQKWDPAAPETTMEDSASALSIAFDRPATARFLKLVALEGHGDRPHAALAEVEVIQP